MFVSLLTHSIISSYIAELDLKEEFKTRMREVFQTLPRPVFIVMRYLFSFLNQ